MKGIAKSRGNYEWEYLSISYIHKYLGLSEGTIKTNIKALLKYKLINPRRNFRNKSEEGYSIYDANQYFPCVELSEQVFNINAKEQVKSKNEPANETKWVNRHTAIMPTKEERINIDRYMKEQMEKRRRDAVS